jgi:hypothetical protein
MSVIKTIYMENTIRYLKEIYGTSPNPLADKIMKGKNKTSSQGVNYILVTEEIEYDYNPAA